MKLGRSLRLVPRRSADRGHADHGWLQSRHTFSFASYYDHAFEGFGALRVLNEDHVARNRGFPPHGHANYEIFSYVVRGALSHKDSLGGHEEVVRRGGVQFTSAGSGVTHSEYAAEGKPVHFLQIWVKPKRVRTTPAYHRRDFVEADKLNRLLLIVEGDRDPAAAAADDAAGGEEGRRDTSPIPIGADVLVYASVLEPGAEVELPVRDGRQYYAHLVGVANGAQLGVREPKGADDAAELAPGDGLFFKPLPGTTPQAGDAARFVNTGSGKAEFLLFDMAAAGR